MKPTAPAVDVPPADDEVDQLEDDEETAARLAAAFGGEAQQAGGTIREYGDIQRGSPSGKKPPAVPRTSSATPAERAAANKALFESVKASRNALRLELTQTRQELDATRAELARHCGEALRTTHHQAALQAELATRQSLIDELRTRLATAEARTELAVATAASPRHPRYSASAAMEAGAQAAEALRSQVEALQSDLILEKARAQAAAAAAAAQLAESEAARLAEKAKRLNPAASAEPPEAGGVVYPADIMAMELTAVRARCAALEARNAELEATAAASAATSHQMTAELAMAAAMLDAQRGQIRAFMDASRAGSAVSMGPAEKSLQAMEALSSHTFISTAPHAVTPGPSTPPPNVQAVPVAMPPAAYSPGAGPPRRNPAAPHNSLAEPQLGEPLPPPKPLSGAAALLGCTTARSAAATPAPPEASPGIVASASNLFGLW